MKSSRAWMFVLTIGCLALVGAEAYLLLGKKHGAFRIHGRTPDRIEQFADGTPVSHAFLMLGNGLISIDTTLISNATVTARVQWTVYRGSVDAPPMTVAATGQSSLTLLGEHPATLTIPLTRDGSSNDRWYTVELRLEAPLADESRRPEVAVMASDDNPDRGGVLWVGTRRHPGSMRMQANWESTTVYRRFVTEGVPNLPPLLRSPVIQALLVMVLHLAFAGFVVSLFRSTRDGGELQR